MTTNTCRYKPRRPLSLNPIAFRQQLLTTAKVRECTVGATTADGLRWFTAQPCRYPFDGGSCLLVASPPVRDLLNFAKDLFGAAMSWWQLPLQPGLLGPSCRKRMKAANERPNDKLLSHGLQKR